MTIAQFAYFKDRSADEIVWHIKYIIADSNLENGPDKWFFILYSNYSALFETVRMEHIYNVLRLMSFPERTINMIKNIYANAVCQPLINDIQIGEFKVTSGVPQGCSLLGVLFNIAMIPLLAKHNCLPTKGVIRTYQTEAERYLTDKGTPVYRNVASYQL